jgi:hypothetical protein
MDPPLVIDELIQFPTDPPFVEAILNDGAWQVNAENLVPEDDLAPQREGPPRCPGCGRVMSDREAAEQGACNDCNGGAW